MNQIINYAVFDKGDQSSDFITTRNFSERLEISSGL
jgi:hypothetical protein